MNSIMPDLRYALRQLRKAPTFALTAVVTLALGIGANTAIFTVFNQVLLRVLPVEKPGQLVRHSKKDMQIVGVVADSKHRGVRAGVIPMVYSAVAQDSEATGLQFYIRTTQSPELAENSVRAALHGLDSKLVIDSMMTMDEQIDNNVSNERMIALLATSFAFVALLMTGVGLYGVLAYATVQRTKEIGIRMALGAQRFAVVRLVLTDMTRVALAGIAVAIPLSVMLARWMRSQLFGVQPFDPLTMAGCIALTVAMVLVAAALPARRAASVEPTKALRTE